MSLDTLPNEIVTRCFSYLSANLLTEIILLENIPDNILEAAANNLTRFWYSKRRLLGNERIEKDNDHHEADFDRFSRIHKILEKKSLKCPLWFHYTWENIPQMHKSLDEINLVYSGQKLAIHANLDDWVFAKYPIFPDHDFNLKITCLSLSAKLPYYDICIDLNTFPNLETFYGMYCKITVDHDHPSLKNLYLDLVTFSSLPINLIKLVLTARCTIEMKEDHPKLPALKELYLEGLKNVDYSLLLRVLWNKDLEHFSYLDKKATNMDEIFSMIGPRVRHFEFSGRFSSKIPTLLHSLYNHRGKKHDIFHSYDLPYIVLSTRFTRRFQISAQLAKTFHYIWQV